VCLAVFWGSGLDCSGLALATRHERGRGGEGGGPRGVCCLGAERGGRASLVFGAMAREGCRGTGSFVARGRSLSALAAAAVAYYFALQVMVSYKCRHACSASRCLTPRCGSQTK